MGLIRSLAFNVAFIAWTAVLGVAFLPLLALPARVMRRAGGWWSRTALVLARAICGIRWRVRGADAIPAGPCIFAAKHQSAWDTLFFPAFFGEISPVAKAELRFIPFYGWYAWRAGTVWVDRGARAAALRGMIRDARAALGEGRPVFVFPQGTRTAPEATAADHPYQPGIAALYLATGVPVVPVALNSGLTWGRRAFVKRPGTVTVEFLPAIAPGLERDAFMAQLEAAIEGATRGLAAEAANGGAIQPDR